MIKKILITNLLLAEMLCFLGCITPSRQLIHSSLEKCENGGGVNPVFQDTDTNVWSEWERNDLGKFISNDFCVESLSNRKILIRKYDNSPALSKFEIVTSVVSMVSLFVIPSKTKKSMLIEIEFEGDKRNGNEILKSEIAYSKFMHVFALFVMPFQDNEIDLQNKLIIEILNNKIHFQANEIGNP